MTPNLRIKNARGESAGQWASQPGDNTRLTYARKRLAEIQAEEPHAGWYLETQGERVGWHRFDEAGQ